MDKFRQEVQNALIQISNKGRVLFAMSICEILYPNYLAFKKNTNWGNADILEKGIDIFLSASSLNQDNDNKTSSNEMIKARKTTKNDSLKNCCTNCPFIEPKDLRMPTSLARFSERAVLKFIKLIHASSNTKIPTIPKSQTNVMRPPCGSPFLKSEYKCQFFIG